MVDQEKELIAKAMNNGDPDVTYEYELCQALESSERQLKAMRDLLEELDGADFNCDCNATDEEYMGQKANTCTWHQRIRETLATETATQGEPEVQAALTSAQECGENCIHQRSLAFLEAHPEASSLAPKVEELEAELKKLRTSAQERDMTPEVKGLLDALKRCGELFSLIRGDWTDPRRECREGWEVIDKALAAFASCDKAQGGEKS